MRQVEGLRIKAGLGGIGADQLHVGQATLGDAALGEADHPVRTVHADDLASGPDPAGQQIQDTERAAAEVDSAPCCRYFDAVEQGFGSAR